MSTLAWSLLLAGSAAWGVHLLVTPARSGARGGTSSVVRRLPRAVRRAMDESGLEDASAAQFAVASLLVGAAAGLPAAAVFGVGAPAAAVALAASLTPAAAWRRQREQRRRAAREAWPQLIEEIRVLTGSGGRSIPQALLDVGLRGPDEMRGAFRAAQREWVLSTDFERTVAVLKDRLADATADAACETLLVAAEVGGDVDSRLRALAEDRRQDLLGRKEARARQAGARLARLFVVVVPSGMALAGLNVGDGAAAYRSPQGQALVVIGVALVVVCWIWASRVMRLPEPERVLDR